MPYNDLRKGRWSATGQEYLITTVTRARVPIFADLTCARLFIRELMALQRRDFGIWFAWVLMPDHFHGLFQLGPTADLSKAIKHLKARSARRVQKHRGLTGNLWEPGFHDRALRKEEHRLAVSRYIVANPLRAGLVERIGDYPHWDCVWL